jgi:hypothetical protein
MKKKAKQVAAFIAIIIVVAISLFAATTLLKPASGQVSVGANLVWEKTFGGTGDDRAFYAANVGDGYVVVGSSASFVPGTTVACIVRFDGEGNQLWNRTFEENYGAEFRYVATVPDGFLVVGNTFYSSGNVDGLALKLDLQGKIIWNTTLTAHGAVNKLFSGTVDGASLVMAGLTQASSSDVASQAWIVKLSQNGTQLWSTTTHQTNDCAARGITLTQNGGYMAAGYANSDGNVNYDFMALKIDAQGSIVWTKTYGGDQSDKAYTITAAADGFVIAGDTRSKGAGDSDAWIIKINDNGSLVWDQTVGGANFDSPSFIADAPSGGYVVCGTTFSFGNGQRDFWLFKLADDGKVEWRCTVGRSGYEEAYAAVDNGQGGYVLAGWTNSVGAGGRYDFYIVDLRPNQ